MVGSFIGYNYYIYVICFDVSLSCAKVEHIFILFLRFFNFHRWTTKVDVTLCVFIEGGDRLNQEDSLLAIIFLLKLDQKDCYKKLMSNLKKDQT